ncbi:hypothetical protein [Streptomyces sp. NBC_00564]|uniref:hypothetical protein n=1 Tax=Streptomyces sp. NBC_00564 TaxID=2903663 RepID=UPI00352CE387|nr:hypothetical protein OG256_19420 [Streptomyces sp. NBC_00564]
MTGQGQYEHVFAPLRGVLAWDVRVPGFIDRDDPVPRFAPMGCTVYLVLDKGYLRVDCLGGHGQLGFRAVSEPTPSPHWDLDEGEFAVGGYGSHFLGDDGQLAAITQVRYALNSESDRAAGTVRAAEIRFQYGGVLFLDPIYHWGIRLRGVGAYERWLAWEREDTHTRAVFGQLEEHVWTA